MSLRRHLLAGGAVVSLAIAIIALRPAFTWPIPAPGIAALERVTLGGTPQWILIRGHDAAKPIVLFLHGGPGMPSMYLAHAFQGPLEEDFVVVHWDRRGAGKSYDPATKPSLMRVTQELADAEQLIRLLLKRFGQSQVILVGHSYGSYLGAELTNRIPNLIRAYVGVGQIACGSAEQSALQDAWLRQEATAAKDTATMAALDRRLPWDRESALFKYGGEVVGMKSFTPLIMIGLRSAEYTLRDALNVPKGVQFTHKHLKFDARYNPAMALMDVTDQFAVPIYFFTGRHDMTTPASCALKFFDQLQAPAKHFVWFEHSAHFPFLEEPQRFHAELVKVAQSTDAPRP
ncbi:MAG TPA: alpha/beta hydrolase [Steroidobacteraceae bacterium]|jgi:pimeloyl-ACP methyl ester carboxylesterase